MTGKITKLRERINTQKAERNLLRKQLETATQRVKEADIYHDDSLQARLIIQQAAEATQKIMEAQMSVLVSSALSGVFPDPYEFKVHFIQRRNKTECDLIFVKGGEEFKPLDSAGGGALDIASFALRVAFWSLKNNSPIILLDEPFRFLSAGLQPKAGELLQKLSEELGIQFIIVTHLKSLIPYGDKIINISNGKVVSDGE